MDEQLKNVSNSHKVREDDSKTKITPPAMKGKVKIKKKNGVVKFAEAFLPEDVSDVRSYILTDVIIPTIKKIAEEIFHIFLYGSSDVNLSRRTSSRTPYQNYYDRKRSSSARPSRETSVYILDEDFIFDYEEDAQDFVRWMLEVIAEESFIRLSEANEQAGRTGPYTDIHYGWTSLNGWKIIDTRRSEGRYVLRLPKPFPVD